MIRRFLEAGDLTGFLRAHRPERQIAQLTRLAEATTKGVYRITYEDETTEVLYVWSAAEDYWPAGPEVAGDPFGSGSGGGVAAFGACHAELMAAGVRVPRLHVLDDSREHYPADLVLVEDLAHGTLEDLLNSDAAAAELCLPRLGESLRAMHDRLGPRFGMVAPGQPGSADTRNPSGASAADIVARRALAHLAAGAAMEPRLAAAQAEVTGLVEAMRAAIRPRAEYRLVHGELGPDHVLLDDDLAPVIVDIEGLTFFDVEWEHAFLRLRFEPPQYAALDLPAVDEDRLAFYDLAQRLSLIEGPLRIATTDYPQREWMLGLADYQLGRVLSLVS
ncbi:MAG TPA: phosphotransferase [Streptosporangiaceae bacterium]